jgi:hypothetical protein
MPVILIINIDVSIDFFKKIDSKGRKKKHSNACFVVPIVVLSFSIAPNCIALFYGRSLVCIALQI